MGWGRFGADEVAAGWGAAGGGAGLEGDVERGAGGVFRAAVEAVDLGVGAAGAEVRAFAQEASRAHADGADGGVGRGASNLRIGQIGGARQPVGVSHTDR